MPETITSSSESGTALSADGALQSDHGQTTIADGVVSKIAGIATREVNGVFQLGGGVARALGSMTQRLSGGESSTQGVSVEVGDKEAAVEVTVVVEYGESIPRVAQQIRENIVRRVEGMAGLKVTEVNIEVNDLHFAGEDDNNDDEK